MALRYITSIYPTVLSIIITQPRNIKLLLSVHNSCFLDNNGKYFWELNLYEFLSVTQTLDGTIGSIFYDVRSWVLAAIQTVNFKYLLRILNVKSFAKF